MTPPTCEAPRWSVVITTRNRAQMLSRAIESCLAQTLACEIVVIDEASSDETADVVKAHPHVVYVRHDTPRGHSAAANAGIKAASGDWIKALDDDDWIAPTCLRVMSDAIYAARQAGLKPVIVTVGAIDVDLQGAERRRTVPLAPELCALRSADLLRLSMQDRATLGTPVQFGHSREAALGVGGWNERRTVAHQHGDEIEFTIELSAVGDAVFVPERLAYRTIWDQDSQSRLSCRVRYDSNVALKDRLARHMGLPSTPQTVKSFLAIHWALIAVRTRRWSEVLPLLLTWLRRPLSALGLLTRHAEPSERVALDT